MFSVVEVTLVKPAVPLYWEKTVVMSVEKKRKIVPTNNMMAKREKENECIKVSGMWETISIICTVDDVALPEHTHGGRWLHFPAVGLMQSGFQIGENTIHP